MNSAANANNKKPANGAKYLHLYIFFLFLRSLVSGLVRFCTLLNLVSCEKATVLSESNFRRF